MPFMDRASQSATVLSILGCVFPQARIALNFSNPLELLIAAILSARTTDKLVNKVTETLFRKYKGAEDYGSARLDALQKDINSVNFFRNKARAIKGCCGRIQEGFGGRVPDTLEGLISLPGVGRKTANIVLGNAFGKEALAVDTHVKRVSKRLGLAQKQDPDDIEEELTAFIPKRLWTKAGLLLILHGRNTCKAKDPACAICPVRDYCDSYKVSRL